MDPRLAEGLTDALGFIAGVLLAFLLARVLGFDPLAAGYGNNALIGIVLCGLGGGAGAQLARRWRKARGRKS